MGIDKSLLDRLESAAIRVGRLESELAAARADRDEIRRLLSSGSPESVSRVVTMSSGKPAAKIPEPAHATTRETLTAVMRAGGSIKAAALGVAVGIKTTAAFQRLKRLRVIGLVTVNNGTYTISDSGRSFLSESTAA